MFAGGGGLGGSWASAGRRSEGAAGHGRLAASGKRRRQPLASAPCYTARAKPRPALTPDADVVSMGLRPSSHEMIQDTTPAGETRNQPMKVTALNGSPRLKGNTAAMIHHVLLELDREGIEIPFPQMTLHKAD